MGRLIVSGKGERSYIADRMSITLCFYGIAHTMRDSMEWVQEQCEDFLDNLQAYGITPENIEVLEEQAVQMSPSGGAKCISARRSMRLSMEADTKLYNGIVSLIRKNNYSCDYQVKYYISDVSQYEEELLKAAVENARKKAEVLATVAGKKLLGISEILHLSETSVSQEDTRLEKGCAAPSKPQLPLSDYLTLHRQSLSEKVEVSWLVEDE